MIAKLMNGGAAQRREDTFASPAVVEVDFSRSSGRARWRVLRRMLLGADLFAGMGAALIGALVSNLSVGEATLLAGLITLSWPVITFLSGLYAAQDLRSWASGAGDVSRLLGASLLASWPFFAISATLGVADPVVVALGAASSAALFTGFTRMGVRMVAHRATSLRQRTLIVGSGQVAGKLIDRLERHDEFGLIPVGVVDDDVHDVGLPGPAHLGRLDDLSEILQEHSIDRVIIAFSRASHEQLLACIRACRDRSVAVDVVPRLFDFLEGARSLDSIAGLPLLSINPPRLSRASRAVKRALDLVVATAALLTLWPLLLLLGIAIKLESPGPAYFRQRRVGRGGRHFGLLKLRSMRVGADERKEEYLDLNDSRDGVMFKIRQDPRVTKVGKLLRRFSLDELPQLVNVLRGEMSLVGPRPLIPPESDALAETWHLRRLELRPGMTGSWQVSGRSDISVEEMVQFDYQYVAGWSLTRDVEILLATAPAILSGRGAY